MNSKRWQDQFTEEYKNLEKNYSAAEGGVSMLAHALDKQIIPEATYFAWALKSFEIPLLKISYFGDHPASTQIWQKWQSRFAWSHDCLPISEWEGHLYVACLEPVDFPAEMKVICILCPVSGLRQLWQKYQSSMSFELIDEVHAESAPASAGPLEANLPAEEQLEGLFMDAPPVSLTKAEAPLLEENPNVREDTIVPIEIPPFEKAPVETLTAEPVAALPPQNTAQIKPPPPAASPAQVSLAAKLEEYYLGTVEKGNPQKFKEACVNLFTQLKHHFPKSLLLGTDHNLQLVKVVAWDETSVENKLAEPTALRGSSIFRIVETTQKSFHGPVVANELNSKFFSDWNNQQLPENVTIAPIVYNDKVIGMVVCIGEMSHYNRVSLAFVEKVAQDFLNQIIPGKAIAA